MLTAGPFLLRPFTATDAPAFAAAVRESCPGVHRWMPWAHAGYTEDDALLWFSLCDAGRLDGTSFEFGIFDAASGTFVGGCGLNQFNVSHGFCNLGYWVRESWQRRGAALAGVLALKRMAFEDLGQGRIEIVVAVGNEASLGVAAKAGALREGLARNRVKMNDEFVDAYVWSLVP